MIRGAFTERQERSNAEDENTRNRAGMGTSRRSGLKTKMRVGDFVMLLLCLALVCRSARAQDPLPMGPMAPMASAPSPQKAATGQIDGTVVDADGDLVSGAMVTLATAGSPDIQKTTTDASGRFHFGGVPPGRFKISATADEMIPGWLSGELREGQHLAASPIRLDLESVESAVQVVASREELAEAEVKVEEHQRVLGVLPNFYVTYDWHAAPLNNRQKFELAWRNFLDPVNVAVDAGIAGVQQADNSFPGYGRGGAGYGKRFAADTGDFLFGSALAGYVFPVIFHQDPRYFYKGTGSIRARAFYAVAAAVICRADNGKWQPNYSNVFGDFAGGAISNLYYPSADRNGAWLTVENGLLNVAYDALGNVFQEFVVKHLTPHAPVYASTSRPPVPAQQTTIPRP